MATFKHKINISKQKIEPNMSDNYDILSENNQSTVVSHYERPKRQG